MSPVAEVAQRLLAVMPAESTIVEYGQGRPRRIVPLEEHADRVAQVVVEARGRARPRPRRDRHDVVEALRLRIRERGDS